MTSNVYGSSYEIPWHRRNRYESNTRAFMVRITDAERERWTAAAAAQHYRNAQAWAIDVCNQAANAHAAAAAKLAAPPARPVPPRPAAPKKTRRAKR